MFGPGVGLIGFAVMFIILFPKIRARWRGFRARQRGPVDCRERITGERELGIAASEAVREASEHPEYGKPLEMMSPYIVGILIESICWCIPLLLTVLFVPAGQFGLRMMCLCVSGFLALIGLFVLAHLSDRVIFYRTGVEIRLRFHREYVDYNSIVSFTERPPLIPWMASSVILHLDDDRILVLDGFYLTRGRRLKSLFAALPQRITHNAAREKMIRQE